MLHKRISRRAVLMGAGAAATWLASPARALLQAAGRVQVPSLVDPLIARMTLEEKAGQLQLMAAAWGGGVALTLNPPGQGSDFEGQVAEARQGILTNTPQQSQRLNTGGATLPQHMVCPVHTYCQN